jgi:hypothetical protein
MVGIDSHYRRDRVFAFASKIIELEGNSNRKLTAMLRSCDGPFIHKIIRRHHKRPQCPMDYGLWSLCCKESLPSVPSLGRRLELPRCLSGDSALGVEVGDLQGT